MLLWVVVMVVVCGAGAGELPEEIGAVESCMSYLLLFSASLLFFRLRTNPHVADPIVL